jgi:hypothetical protein
MGILVILMSMSVVGGRFALQRANRIKHQNAVDQVYTALQSYYADNREYPSRTEAQSMDNLTQNLLGDYMDYGAWDGGSDATFYYEVDSTQQVVLVCVALGGVNDESKQGWYCNGNGFGVLPSTTNPVPNSYVSNTDGQTLFTSFTIVGNWESTSRSWQ